MAKLAEQPAWDYLLAMQGFLLGGHVYEAKQYAELVEQILAEHADTCVDLDMCAGHDPLYSEVLASRRGKAKVYTAIGFSIDDAIALDDADNDNDDNPRKYQEIYERLGDTERLQVAEALGDWLWNGNQWEERLRELLDSAAASQQLEASRQAAAGRVALSTAGGTAAKLEMRQ